jgi:hypothetical protein
MSKNVGIEIFELFRNSSRPRPSEPPRTAAAEPAKPPTTRPRPAPRAETPAPRPADVAKPEPSGGDAVVSMRLNTALFALMVGAACLFGAFALGVKYERGKHAPASTAALENTSQPPPSPLPAAKLPPVVRETPRREAAAPPQPKPAPENPPPAAEPRKGWTLQLMAYPEADRRIAETMLQKVQDAGGAEASLVADRGNLVVVAGFVEKQSGNEAEALMAKYRSMGERLRKSFNLNWISAVR